MAKKNRSLRRITQLDSRKREQKARSVAKDRARLFALGPGGSHLAPLEVPSSVVIETRARAMNCPQCGGRFAVKDHQVDQRGDELLRIVLVQCLDCATPQKLWFRVALPRLN